MRNPSSQSLQDKLFRAMTVAEKIHMGSNMAELAKKLNPSYFGLTGHGTRTTSQRRRSDPRNA